MTHEENFEYVLISAATEKMALQAANKHGMALYEFNRRSLELGVTLGQLAMNMPTTADCRLLFRLSDQCTGVLPLDFGTHSLGIVSFGTVHQQTKRSLARMPTPMIVDSELIAAVRTVAPCHGADQQEFCEWSLYANANWLDAEAAGHDVYLDSQLPDGKYVQLTHNRAA